MKEPVTPHCLSRSPAIIHHSIHSLQKQKFTVGRKAQVTELTSQVHGTRVTQTLGVPNAVYFAGIDQWIYAIYYVQRKPVL